MNYLTQIQLKPTEEVHMASLGTSQGLSTTPQSVTRVWHVKSQKAKTLLCCILLFFTRQSPIRQNFKEYLQNESLS